jgi:hypothetical protein
MSAGYMRRCAGKERHPDKQDARRARAALAADTGKKVSFYACDQCLGYHIGRAGNRFISRLRTGKRPNKRLRGRV